jgi:hypothetical protein
VQVSLKQQVFVVGLLIVFLAASSLEFLATCAREIDKRMTYSLG